MSFVYAFLAAVIIIGFLIFKVKLKQKQLLAKESQMINQVLQVHPHLDVNNSQAIHYIMKIGLASQFRVKFICVTLGYLLKRNFGYQDFEHHPEVKTLILKQLKGFVCQYFIPKETNEQAIDDFVNMCFEYIVKGSVCLNSTMYAKQLVPLLANFDLAEDKHLIYHMYSKLAMYQLIFIGFKTLNEKNMELEPHEVNCETLKIVINGLKLDQSLITEPYF